MDRVCLAAVPEPRIHPAKGLDPRASENSGCAREMIDVGESGENRGASCPAVNDVRDQFERTARVLDEWATEARQGSPRPGAGGTVIVTAGFGDEGIMGYNDNRHFLGMKLPEKIEDLSA